MSHIQWKTSFIFRGKYIENFKLSLAFLLFLSSLIGVNIAIADQVCSNVSVPNGAPGETRLECHEEDPIDEVVVTGYRSNQPQQILSILILN